MPTSHRNGLATVVFLPMGLMLGCLGVHDLTPPNSIDASTPDAAAASNDATTNDSDAATGADDGTGQPCVSRATGCSCPPSASTSCSGTCINVQTDAKNCGACANDCTTKPHVMSPAGVMCNAGVCSVPTTSCAAGFAHCSANPADICETDLSQTTHCGTCGNVCPAATPLCAKGASGGYGCVTGCTPPAMTICAGTCTDSNADAKNCGGCGTVCPALTCSNGKLTAASTCSGGTCTAPVPTDCGGFACNAAGTACLTNCTPPQTNCAPTTPYCIGAKCVAQKLNNGQMCSVGSDCMIGSFCVNGVCCNSACIGQCSTCNTGTCAAASGASCTPNAPGAATGQCDSNGACAIQSCSSGYCKSSPVTPPACVKRDDQHCGPFCSDDCTFSGPNTMPGGTCDPITNACKLNCVTGYADCDGVVPNGCEALLSGLHNCGGCKRDCDTCVKSTPPFDSWCDLVNPTTSACYMPAAGVCSCYYNGPGTGLCTPS